MGGLEKGEVASGSVVNHFINWFHESVQNFINVEDKITWIQAQWLELSAQCNNSIKNYGNSLGIKLGTTITALLIDQGQYYVLNIGDSRTYRIHDYVTMITKDQSLVAREVEQGIITPEQAKSDPRRSVLLQCIGASEVIYPDIFTGQIQPGDSFLLCSDGFCHEIQENEILACVNNLYENSQEQLQEQLNKLIQINKARGERDNITAIDRKSVV